MGRECEFLDPQGEWKEIEFTNLREGMTFRFYDNGVLYEFEGKSSWTATCDAYLNDEGIGEILVDEEDKEDGR